MRIEEGNFVQTTTLPPNSMTTSTGSSNDSPAISEPLLPLATLPIEDCVYRGEGNANVVIALPQDHKVIRFRKSLPDDVSPDGGKQRAEREVEFVKYVASRFLGTYAQIPEILRYDIKDIATLSEAIWTLRPDKRRHKEITEIYATKFPDYTFLPKKFNSNLFRRKETFCVEIKPKQGYLRDTDWKFQKCLYCLTQYCKVKNNVITTRSTYCPFDLFSGVEERMKSALKGLIKSPQNNFKIFKDGMVVYDQQSSSNELEYILEDWFHNSAPCTNEGYIDKFCNLICNALLHQFPQEEFKPHNFTDHELHASIQRDFKATYIHPDILAKAKKLLYFTGEMCNLKGETLPPDSILERLLRMQMVPFISTEHVYNIYSQFHFFLTDDMVYSNLLKTYKYNKHTKNGESTQTLNESYPKTHVKVTSISKTSKFHNDYNGNKHMSAESARFTNNEPMKHVSPMPISTSFPIYIKANNSVYNKSNTVHNGDNLHYSEEEINCLINAESMLSLQNYLLFSCARDCSILIAFQEVDKSRLPLEVKDNIIELSDDISFVCNIGVSDLDPKNLYCIEKHRQRDINALESVVSVIEEELALKNQLSIQNQQGE